MNPLFAALLTGGGQVTQSEVFVEDVYVPYVYKGNGSARTITDNIDRSKGALDIFKSRSGATAWAWYDTVRGTQKDLSSSSSSGQATQTQGVSAFNTDGVSIGNLGTLNTNSAQIVKFTYRQAPKFFRLGTVNHVTGTNSTVDLGYLGTVGMVVVKGVDVTSSWYTWHRSTGAGYLLLMNSANARTSNSSISVSGTVLTISSSLATGQYVFWAWAHDTDAETSIIKCDSFTTNGSGVATVTLDWEPQEVMIKISNGGTGSWRIKDTMRGLVLPSNEATHNTPDLVYESTAAEALNSTIKIRNNQILFTGLTASSTYVFRAIRRGPMRPPTEGTQMLDMYQHTGTWTEVEISGRAFPVDKVWVIGRGATDQNLFFDRLRGPLLSMGFAGNEAENTLSDGIKDFARMDGFLLGDSGASGALNYSGRGYMYYLFRRAHKAFDMVSWVGNGAIQEVPHFLGTTPELYIIGTRDAFNMRPIGSIYMDPYEYISWNGTAASIITGSPSTHIWSGHATATVLKIGAYAEIAASGQEFYGHLFATLPGVTKVFTYTGNGSSQIINCGFTNGARFVMIRRRNGTGGVHVWDTSRGIVSGTEDYSRFDLFDGDFSGTDSIDPHASGFIVNQNGTTNVNVSGGTYIGLAIA